MEFSREKDGNTDTRYKEEAWQHYAKWRKPQNTSHCMIHLHEMSRRGKSTETESMSVVARGLGEQEMEWLLMGMGFIWGRRNCPGIRQLCCSFEYTKKHWLKSGGFYDMCNIFFTTSGIKSEQSIDTLNNIEVSQNHYWKKLHQKRAILSDSIYTFEEMQTNLYW